MTVLLSGLAALAYGIADFTGGLASRRRQAINVLLISYPVGGAVMLALGPFFGGHIDARVVLFGALGRSVRDDRRDPDVQPDRDCPDERDLAGHRRPGRYVPIVAGVAGGEKPALLTWLAIAVGLLAVVLVSRTSEDNPHGSVTGRVLLLALVSGLGFGLYFVFLARSGDHSGIWPLVVSRLTSAVLILPLAARRGAFNRIGGATLGLVVVTGILDAVANLFFLLAARHGYLSIAGVITSMYPAATVVLAVTVLREHLNRWQGLGLALAAASVAVIGR